MLTDAQIADLKTKHGDVWAVDNIKVDGETVDVVVKRHSKGELQRTLKAMSDEDRRIGAAREFCSKVVVHPPLEQWHALCDDVELLPVTVFANVAQRSAGDAKTDLQKL